MITVAEVDTGNPYGYFDAAAREYVITRPDTPTPWLNYLGEGRYGGIVSNTAGGYSFDRDPRNRRVTRYRYNGIPADQPGRYVYLRDQETGGSGARPGSPPRRDLDAYECRHGAGLHAAFGAPGQGSRPSSSTSFRRPIADETCPCELWVLRVRNTGGRRAGCGPSATPSSASSTP